MMTKPKRDAVSALRDLHIACESFRSYELSADEPDVAIAADLMMDAHGKAAHELAAFLVSRPFPWAKGVRVGGLIYEPCNVEDEGRPYVAFIVADSDEGRRFGRTVDLLNDPDVLDSGWKALEDAQAFDDAIDREGEGWKTGQPDEWTGD